MTPSVDGALQAARVAEQSGDIAGALQALEEVPLNERTGLWYYARGAIALREHGADEAVGFLREAVRREPTIPEYRSNLGAALLEKRKAGDAAAGAEALAELEAAVTRGPVLPDLYANLSFARLAAGDASGALAAADVGLRVEASHVTCLYNRAAALHALGRLNDALATLNALLRISPDCAAAITSRGHLLRRLEMTVR